MWMVNNYENWHVKLLSRGLMMSIVLKLEVTLQPLLMAMFGAIGS
jgi:hypothetical protein